jgi:hypothetical protein
MAFALAVLFLPRRFAAVSIIAAVCYLTEGLPLELAGFHFTSIRFVLLTGMIRVLCRREISWFRFNTIDRSLFMFGASILIISVLRHETMEDLVYQFGILYNASLSYIVFRCLLRNERDLREILGRLAVVLVPFALLVLYESFTNRNLFAALAGMNDIDLVRDGAIRGQGSFRSPITAGAFGATFAILYASVLFASPRTRFALVGIVASTTIVICSHSSGPLLGLGIGLLALACWFVRRHTSKIRWGIVATLVGLSLVMKAPVWFLIGRISDVVGGGGYHRAYLIDKFVGHFSSWWLMGTSDTSEWMPTQLEFGGADLTNKFVSDGVNGGLVSLVLSVLLVVRCFQRLGAALKAHRGEPAVEKMLWGMGSTLVATTAIFFSVTYFDQSYVIWYFLLACIASVDVRKRRMTVATVQRRRMIASRFAPGLSNLP